MVAALALVVGGAVLYEAFLVFATPPNNWDSMSYHLSRAAAWYQRHRVEYVPAHAERENAFQPNSEIEILYTFAFLSRDTVAAATQWLAELALLAAVFGCARRLGFARPAALLAALLTATLTEIALQSVTTQNDLLSAAFVAAAACLVLGSDPHELPLAGTAAGLALGTKLTAAFALPILALLTLSRPARGRTFAYGTAWAVAGFLAFGAYGYVLNLVETGSPTGRSSALEEFRPEVTSTGTISTLARLGYRFVDLPGFHPPSSVTDWLAARGEGVFSALAIDPNPFESTSIDVPFTFAVNDRANEDISFFGPLGLVLLFPLVVCFLVASAIRRVSLAHVAFALTLPLYVVLIALTARYNVWLGRFLVAPVALTMPLAAVLYRSRLLAAAVALAGALTLGLAHAYNEAKPTGLDRTPAVWSLSRAQAQSILRPEMTQVIEGIEQYVNPHKKFGYVLVADDWDYPLYGPRLGRKLVPMPVAHMLETAERRRIDWILIDRDVPRPPPRESWTTITFHDSGWSLFLYPEELSGG